MKPLQIIIILLVAVTVSLGYAFSFPELETNLSAARAGAMLGFLSALMLGKMTQWNDFGWTLAIFSISTVAIIGDHSFLAGNAWGSFTVWCAIFLSLLSAFSLTAFKYRRRSVAVE